MQVLLIKSNFKYFSQLFKNNKTIRQNIFNKNIIIYKYKGKNFSNKIEDIEKEIENLKENKSLSLNEIYGNKDNSIQNEDEKGTNLIKIQKIGNEEVELFVSDKKLSKVDNFKNYKDFIERKEKYEQDYTYHRMKVGISIFILFLGLFTLWVPLYKSICESQGFSVKTTHTDYKFDGKKLNVMKKFTVKFIKEVDSELPWSFEPLQESVVVNAGETCLVFYRAKNLTDEPLIGLSVYGKTQNLI